MYDRFVTYKSNIYLHLFIECIDIRHLLYSLNRDIKHFQTSFQTNQGGGARLITGTHPSDNYQVVPMMRTRKTKGTCIYNQ